MRRRNSRFLSDWAIVTPDERRLRCRLFHPLIERRAGDTQVLRNFGHGSLVQTDHFDYVVTERLGYRFAMCPTSPRDDVSGN